MEEIRLQKFISENGLMSRRSAEKEILQGNIRVNGKTVEPGTKIDPSKDEVTYLGKKVESDDKKHFVYIMLNKPRGYVSTLSDEKGRKCVAELVSDVGTRVYPVGRLDMDSDGLLLFTNDGDLTNKLTHPKHNIPKIYHVRVNTEITNETLKTLNGKMIIDDYEIRPVKTDVVTRKAGYTVMRMELYEGRNRQIRKMCELCELEIVRLQRVAIGSLKLGDVPPGKWRFLTKSQVDYLKNMGS